MTLCATSLFTNSCTVFWATTYTFEPSAFEEFWFRRLGDAPLNATILADFNRMTHLWATIEPEEEWRLRRANNDYLIRSVRFGSGSFHPKTYFFGSANHGDLLVGSGNLTLSGLEEGHEVFAHFSRSDDAALPVFCGWRDWMSQIVSAVNDHALYGRWSDALNKAPWLRDLSSTAVFSNNWQISFLDQLKEQIEPPIDELHVSAPFFDNDCEALSELIEATRPSLDYS